MQCRRKLCFGALLCGIAFLMFATHSIQKIRLMPVSKHGAHPLTATISPRTLAQPLPTQAARLHGGVACGCPSCVADSGRSEWFDKHYEPLQQPFLTAQNSSLPPLARKWWMGIQHSPPEPTMEEVMRNVFEVVSSPQPDWLPQKNRCRRCAVVGNSGNLLGSKFGTLIDSHTSVIRMNRARTPGFEEDVGNKTTHHIIYPESAVDMMPGVTLVLLPFKVRDLQWLISALTTGEIKTTYMRVKDRVRADKDKIMVVHPAFFRYTYDNWTEHHGKYPSTGMLALIFSLHICDEVSVFGYGADEKGNWHHYWEHNRDAGAFRKTGVHNADYEMEIIQKLAAEGKIQLHKR